MNHASQLKNNCGSQEKVVEAKFKQKCNSVNKATIDPARKPHLSHTIEHCLYTEKYINPAVL